MNKVVIIDDEPQVRRLLSMVLKSRNYEVHEAEDGPSGLQHIAFLRPEAKFASLEEMTAQIDDDASMARMILSAG
jgi:CheY-like chemotaxis protein